MNKAALARTGVAAYAQRMNKVLDHIDHHLDAPLDLSTLAAVAHFSSFHFHRVFAAWMGETLGDYLRRRRLDMGAVHLAGRPQASVLEIALAVGFGSGEAFARAFKLRFGNTPSAWRAATPQRWADELAATRRRHADRNLDQGLRKQDQVQGLAFRNDQDFSNLKFNMKVNIVTLPAARVAYMRHIGPYGANVSRFWSETFFPWRMAHGLDAAPCYGIGLDDPGITAPAKCRYDACVEVPDSFVAKSPASIANLSGGRYAVAQFKGCGSDIGLAWTELLRDWLPASGMQADGRPFFEYYPGDACKDPETGTFECQLCLPVRPL
ncbi:AraC family transcriptional regulator [Rhodoferax ferrireducens]|uniref:AraC family transcriptional regulator n=1 Tax=Rhodoferax ferrireducens TaxID=192843 RepID=UPI0018E4E90B|nr:GyrI-like domain-containing protein [Rhodoferax ferrireducens]